MINKFFFHSQKYTLKENMPPYRRTRKRTYRRRKPGRYTIYKRAGKQLWRDVQTLKNAINVEYKVHDTSLSSDIGTSALVYPLNTVPAGDDYTARDGRQIRIKSLQINADLNQPSGYTGAHFIRAILFIDKQGLDIPTFGDLLTTTPYLVAPRNLNNRRRYVILRDWRITLNPDHPNRVIKYFKRLDMKTLFDGSGAVYNDVASNQIWILLISNQATPNAPNISGFARIRFLDN